MKKIKTIFMLGTLAAMLSAFSFQAKAADPSQTPTVPCKEHVEEIDWGEEPTCTSGGWTDGSHCSVCGEILVKQEPLPPSGHDFLDSCEPATLGKDGYWCMACDFCGYAKKPYRKIYALQSIALSKTSYTYNGKVRKPAVIIKDRKGKKIPDGNASFDYPEGMKNVGKYKVRVALYGDYDGVKNLYFTIHPQNTSITKLTPKKKAFTIKIKKYTTQTTGYQIQYAANKKFKNAKTVYVSNKTTTKTMKNLKSRKTYYVRIRTYKTVNNHKYYSSFGKVKAIKTK